METSSLSLSLRWLGRILKMRYEGGTRYATYQTPQGLITFRLGDHNAVGRNFADRAAGSAGYVSVFVERGTHPYVPTTVPYTEIRYPLEVFNRKPQAVFDSIIAGVDGMLDNGDFTVSPDLGEKKVYSPSQEA